MAIYYECYTCGTSFGVTRPRGGPTKYAACPACRELPPAKRAELRGARGKEPVKRDPGGSNQEEGTFWDGWGEGYKKGLADAREQLREELVGRTRAARG
jgi:hypothetical protein